MMDGRRIVGTPFPTIGISVALLTPNEPPVHSSVPKTSPDGGFGFS